MKGIKAHTNYGDLKGTASFDFKGGTLSELTEYAKSKGIDVEKHEPIGLKLYGGEFNTFNLSILCIDKENIASYKKQNNNQIPVIKISVIETYENFEKTFKQFSVSLILSNLKTENYDLQ